MSEEIKNNHVSPSCKSSDTPVTTEEVKEIVQTVIQKEMESLYNKMSKSILDTLNKQLKDVSEELSKVKESIEFMNAEFEECKIESIAMKKSYKELQDENCKVKSAVQELTIRVNQLEQSARSSNAEIQCVPERKTENVLNIVKDIYLTDGKNYFPIALCAVYIPPPIQSRVLECFLSNCNSLFDKLKQRTCIVGDFNLPDVNWKLVNDLNSNYTASFKARSLIDFCYINKLRQYNFVENKMRRILDLVLINSLHCTVNEANDILTIIDPLHPPIEIQLLISETRKLKYNSNVKKRNFYKADYEKIREHLSKINWDMLFMGLNDINSIVSVFYKIVNLAIEKFVPWSTIKSDKYPIWFSRSLINVIKEKNKVRCRHKKYNNAMDLLSLKLLNKRCDKLAKTCYNVYIKSIEDNIVTNSKVFWSYIKNKRHGNSKYPSAMSNGSVMTTDATDICNHFASHFSSVYTVDNPNGLRPKRGPGPDSISPYFITECAIELSTPLCFIYNKSLQTGCFPDIWKLAKVVPIHKADDDTLVSNYRPISILSTFPKIFESLVCPYIQNYTKQFITDDQHGFVKSRSTCSNLVTFVETLVKTVDMQQQIDVIYTDFSKAFDRVSHVMLLRKLETYGFSDPILAWLRSYLKGRNYFVVVNGFSSDIFPITSGVPQGSHLGPILFNIFVNDIPNCFLHSNCFMYADDLKFCKIVNKSSDMILLQEDLTRLSKWCDVYGMTLNLKKCAHIKFTRKNNIFPSVYTLNGVVIQEVETVKDLGVVFDKKLTFIPQLENVIKRSSQALGFVIRNSKEFRNVTTKKLLYFSIVRNDCKCSRPLDDYNWYKPRDYRTSPGVLALENWRQNPFIWLHYVESNDGLQPADYVLRAHDTCFWSIEDVQRYFRGQLHCEEVLFTCEYPNLSLPTPIGLHSWRSNVALKRPSANYLKEFHRSLEITLKKMEAEQAQIDRLIICDQLIKVDLMDYFKRKTFFRILLNILSCQDSLQLVSLENLRCSRLEGVRLIQQLACFNAHSLKYLFLWQFVRSDENPILVNYNYITGSGEYTPRPQTSQCFLRSLGELRNLRVLALEYAHLADGTGTAIVSLLPVIKRPHFRLQLICREEHTPGRADPSLGGGGNGVPDYAWRRVAIACPDLYLVMVFYRVRDYDFIRRFLSPSVPLKEVHLHQGIRLEGEDFDASSFVRLIAGHFASSLVTLSIQQWRVAAFPLRRTLELMPTLVRFCYVGCLEETDLRNMLLLVACGVCHKLKQLNVQVQDNESKREYWKGVVKSISDEFADVMKLFDVDLSLKIYKC
ncbi:unnamed protein product [Parnassius mnemosyne]|uniref:Reverse transcriptase domain-containing protein n=1 Tax=Parnassius mnemosyne TaxID=213953 RepID=A0AAV1L1C4_9NEOP